MVPMYDAPVVNPSMHGYTYNYDYSAYPQQWAYPLSPGTEYYGMPTSGYAASGMPDYTSPVESKPPGRRTLHTRLPNSSRARSGRLEYGQPRTCSPTDPDEEIGFPSIQSTEGVIGGREPPPKNQLDIGAIENGTDTRTTVMIKNIPNKMTDKDLMGFIARVCPRKIDFLYLRMDFQNGAWFMFELCAASSKFS